MTLSMAQATRAGAPKILVMDWGIGGLATFAGLDERWPGVPLRYLSDSGFTPWGKVEPDALAERISALARPLLSADDLLILACNAASTVMDRLHLPRDVEVMGVIAPGVTLLERELRRGRRRLAVLGGARTIASGAHRLGLETRLSGSGQKTAVSLLELVAQPLSAHVEAGRLDGPELLGDLMPLIGALRTHDCEAALLACTHYPALLPVLWREAPGIDWLDPVSDPLDGLLGQVARVGRFDSCVSGPDPSAPLTHSVEMPKARAERTLTTTGDPEATSRAAFAAFGLHFPEVRRAI